MGQEWRFEQDERAQWRWIHIDEKNLTITSSQTFPDQVRCMVDAMRFVVRRRRPEPASDDPERVAQTH